MPIPDAMTTTVIGWIFGSVLTNPRNTPNRHTTEDKYSNSARIYSQTFVASLENSPATRRKVAHMSNTEIIGPAAERFC